MNCGTVLYFNKNIFEEMVFLNIVKKKKKNVISNLNTSVCSYTWLNTVWTYKENVEFLEMSTKEVWLTFVSYVRHNYIFRD